MANDNEPVSATALSPTPEKHSFLKDVAHGLGNVAKVIWRVPAARGYIATLLVRFGIPGALVAVGMAVGEQLAS